MLGDIEAKSLCSFEINQALIASKKKAFDRRLGGQSHLRADEIFTPENKEPGENVCKKRLALRA
jgi:hypothetical protein